MANPTTYFTFLDQTSGNPLPGGLTATIYPQGASQIPGNVVSTGTTDANGAAPLQLAASTYYTAVFTGTGAPAYPYNFQTGAFSQIVGPFVDTVNNQTIGGAKTFSSPITVGPSSISSTGAVIAGNINASSGGFQLAGNLVVYGDLANTFIAPMTAGSSVYVRNSAGTNNVQFPDGGGLVLVRGALTATGVNAQTGTVQGSSNGVTTSYIPPTYTAAGAAVASTVHAVRDTFSGTGGTVTVTLSGAAAFSGPYVVTVYNYTSGAAVSATIVSGTSFTVAGTVNGNTYVFVAIGV